MQFTSKSKKAKLQTIAIALLALVLVGAATVTYSVFKTYSPKKLSIEEPGQVAGIESETLDLRYPNGKVVSEHSSNEGIFTIQQTSDNPEKIITYFSNYLKKMGWTRVNSLNFKKGNEEISITLTKETKGRIVIQINYSFVPTK